MGIVRAAKISFSYGSVPLLTAVSLKAEKGAFTAICGPNGSGKSTLLRLLAGQLAPQAGEALLKCMPALSYSPYSRARIAALVPASMQLPFDFTVFETVLMGRAPKLSWWRDYSLRDIETANHSLTRLGILALRNRAVNSLSSGEQQKVFIAQALAQEPEILFLDEPTAHLDITGQAAVFELLKSLSASGMTVIAVTHDIALAAKYCKSIVLLKDGGVYAQGEPARVLTEETIADVYGVRAELRHAKTGILVDILGTTLR